MAKTTDIIIQGARENNLKDISVNIPKQKITVFTGVSGSGKSSLVFDTIAAESQRQLNETFSTFVRNRMPHYGQPEVDSLQNLSVAIIVDQKRIGGNARSTVGTVTDIYSLLRLLYSRIGQPFIGEAKLFSFNNPDGMCKRCQGLGTISELNTDRLIDKNKSLNEGAIRFPTFLPGTYRWKRYVLTGLFDNDKKLKDYTKEEWDTLLYNSDVAITNPLPGWYASTEYEAVVPRFQRSYLGQDSREKARYAEALQQVVHYAACPLCKGGRLNQQALSVKIKGKSIADCSAMQLDDLQSLLQTITASKARTILSSLKEQLEGMASVGLEYLSLNRETNTLSGGESQRVKMVRHLGSSLSDLTYILDEPSVGLHPKDVDQLNQLIKRLRDKGNTVLAVEHDPDVIAIADHIVDIGPKAGIDGGHVVYEGSLSGLQRADTLTGQYLRHRPQLQTSPRKGTGALAIRHASLHNLQHISVDIPRHVLTVVTGVAGSGKSTLINGVLAAQCPEANFIDQGALGGSKRSNPATYTGLLDPIRDLFARQNHVDASLFSSNSKGACPECKGLGITYTDLAFMDTITSVCEVCHGKRFTDEVLQYKVRDKNIYDVLVMSVVEALVFFTEPYLQPILQRLKDVGLGYLSLGQPLSTLSGGERQRIKLATALEQPSSLYILDEPTTGLHMSDVNLIIGLMNRLVDDGSTVIVIEHNLDVISQADWVIDLGPGAGRNGGKLLFTGTPGDLIHNQASYTGTYLRRSLSEK